jgi:hypothetical protein
MGLFQGIDPTARKVEVLAFATYRVADGRIGSAFAVGTTGTDQ